MFLGVKRAWRPFDEPSSRVESGLTARSEAKGRGRDADAFSDCTGMCCQKSPGRNEQHREPRAARLGAGHVAPRPSMVLALRRRRRANLLPANLSLVTFFAPKKGTRPPGRDPAMVAAESIASRASSLPQPQGLGKYSSNSARKFASGIKPLFSATTNPSLNNCSCGTPRTA